MLTQLLVPGPVRSDAESAFAACGAEGNECVVYLCGAGAPGGSKEVARCYHPNHEGSAEGYTVPVAELSRLNSWLYREKHSVFAQVHTHPRHAFHSSIDDRWPIIEMVGFLSLVVPDFGQKGLLGLPGCYLAEYLGAGTWREVPSEEMLACIRFRS